MSLLVDMKRTPADKKAERDKWENPTTGTDDYGYGLTISLDNTALEKLGVSVPAAGEAVNMVAECVVTEDRITTVNGKVERSLSLQLRKLHLSQGEATDIVGTLYGKE